MAVSESVAISSGIAARYAQALFELARDDKALAALEGMQMRLTPHSRAAPICAT